MKTRTILLHILTVLMSLNVGAQTGTISLPDAFGYSARPDTTGIGLPVGRAAGAESRFPPWRSYLQHIH